MTVDTLTCAHCGARVYRRPGGSGRYALTDRADGTDTLGSGCECPANEAGHEVAPEDAATVPPVLTGEQRERIGAWHSTLGFACAAHDEGLDCCVDVLLGEGP